MRPRETLFFTVFLLVLFAAFASVSLFLAELSRVTRSAFSASVQASIVRSLEAVAGPAPVTLVFVGDVMLSRGVGEIMEEEGDYQYPFLDVADVLRDADITFGNLEGPMSSRGRDVGSEYSFRADPRAVEGLVYAGFDVMSIANNHIWDWGPDALADTVTLLSRRRIATVGAGSDEGEANRGVVISTDGTRVGFLAYTTLYPESLEARGPRPGVSDLDQAPEHIAALARQADALVVSLHWGEEYVPVSNKSQQALARRLIDAGADIVVGHHPHVAQEAERYRDGLIIYSLGNFVFDQTFSEPTRRGLVVRVTLVDGRVSDAETEHVYISETFKPAFVDL